MKRLFCAVLALLLLCSLTACGQTENTPGNKTDIVGEWMAPSINAAATFNEDGTGELSLYGNHTASWKYDSESDRYIVTADTTYTVFVGKEYDMDYMSLDGIDFYRPDDYDKAATLMISRRCEDIFELTAEMTQLKTDDAYDIANGVTIQFTGISVSKTAENDGLQLDYIITNDRTDAITAPITLDMNCKCYLADEPDAVTLTQPTTFLESIDAESGYTGSVRFSLLAKVDDTVARYGMVIGAVYFEMYGQTYYVDLAIMK